MSSKRQEVVDYAEESCTDEDEEMEEAELELERKLCARPRPGRPRKTSLTTNSSMETVKAGEPSARRRGRGPSKRPCLNKNALMARENRQRKKEYIERIEGRLQFYQRENQELNNTIQKQSIEIKRLVNEVAYLKTVLNNSTIVTSLLRAMNDSLRKMHGGGDAAAVAAHPSDKQSSNVANWIASEQSTLSKARSAIKEKLEMTKEEIKRSSFAQSNNPVKIARKTMPFTNMLPKSENSSIVERILKEDEKMLNQKSPQSSSRCEYNTVKSSMGLDSQLPTTPMSILSSSVDKGEASLSDTDFSQLSSFNVDLFGNLDEVANPLQFEQDNSDIFNEETLFRTLEKDTSTIKTETSIDPLKISIMSNTLNEKTLFNSLENTGVCLHINSSRVSLEYCSICHSNSLNYESV
ncbi:PREDICTED: uncharacterized protein LOC105363137 [Ceratosolen solmsi marchali]|uniref:Uncharacterized protein LOC105363137 n=1 Tax=Ceratosolen solmsi marchali TaxID=326594 RepID=A0AAJ7DWK3_9HYME|nr:PREDICTED: uncharacterized protein LOC105363137 [Ceratosolen solmsi marchali]